MKEAKVGWIWNRELTCIDPYGKLSWTLGKFIFWPRYLSLPFSSSSPPHAPTPEDTHGGWELKRTASEPGKRFQAPIQRQPLRRLRTARRKGGEGRPGRRNQLPLLFSTLGGRRDPELTFPEPASWRPSPAGSGRPCQKPSKQPSTTRHQYIDSRHLQNQQWPLMRFRFRNGARAAAVVGKICASEGVSLRCFCHFYFPYLWLCAQRRGLRVKSVLQSDGLAEVSSSSASSPKSGRPLPSLAGFLGKSHALSLFIWSFFLCKWRVDF